jgi:chromate transporter
MSNAANDKTEPVPPREAISVLAIFAVFLRLGLTSFGGPVAHIGYFRDEFVTRKRWIGARDYADLVALCQFLPGPASSQVGMAIGLARGGLAGSIAAWLGFTLPSALVMIAAGYGILALGTDGTPGWVEGLKIVAVAVVAQAVWGMGRSHAADLPRIAIVAIGAAVALLWPSAWSQIAIIAGGAIAGLFMPATADADGAGRNAAFGAAVGRSAGAAALIAFVVLLVALPLLAAGTVSPTVGVIDAAYRSGALVFGGGHVVLPLLDEAVVAPGWIGEDTFLAGYGLAQAVPGPLFTFGAYLGTAMDYGPGGALGGVIALVAIFLPSFLLIVGVLPYWDGLRHVAPVRRALSGVNAAVVGLLLAALWDPVIVSAIHDWRGAALALAALVALMLLRLPPWIVVAATAAGGALVGAL